MSDRKKSHSSGYGPDEELERRIAAILTVHLGSGYSWGAHVTALRQLAIDIRNETIEECARWLDTAEWPETAALMRDDLLSSSGEPK